MNLELLYYPLINTKLTIYFRDLVSLIPTSQCFFIGKSFQKVVPAALIAKVNYSLDV
jgi:hypothetical protein